MPDEPAADVRRREGRRRGTPGEDQTVEGGVEGGEAVGEEEGGGAGRREEKVLVADFIITIIIAHLLGYALINTDSTKIRLSNIYDTRQILFEFVIHKKYWQTLL